MLNFCTLFDSNFLHFGMAMYRSLQRHCPAFHLYVFAFDDACYKTLTKASLPNMTVISLSEFEDPELLKIKATRSKGEYCWTSTSSTILYCLDTFTLEHCTYVDADIYFFADPTPLVEELGEYAVSIIPHRYSAQYAHLAPESGIYCVQFMTFKNNPEGKKVLEWWRDACLDWCYARIEDGKFGDQKYLDDWTERFPGIVKVLEHEGGGVAPWNFTDYVYAAGNVTNIRTNKSFPLVFFHFHNIKTAGDSFNIGGYIIPESYYARIYMPYIAELQKIRKEYGTISTVPAVLPVTTYTRICKFDFGKLAPSFPLSISPVALLALVLYKNCKHFAKKLLQGFR